MPAFHGYARLREHHWFEQWDLTNTCKFFTFSKHLETTSNCGNIEGEASFSHLVGKVEDDSMETIQWECFTCANRHRKLASSPSVVIPVGVTPMFLFVYPNIYRNAPTFPTSPTIPTIPTIPQQNLCLSMSAPIEWHPPGVEPRLLPGC